MIIQTKNPNDYTFLKIVPRGTPTTWGSGTQIFNTDFVADPINYEAAEFTWENNLAYINVFKGGTGTQRPFKIYVGGASNVAFVADTDVGVWLKPHFKAGAPTTADMPDGFWGVWVDTNASTVYLYYRWGVSMLKVQLT